MLLLFRFAEVLQGTRYGFDTRGHHISVEMNPTRPYIQVEFLTFYRVCLYIYLAHLVSMSFRVKGEAIRLRVKVASLRGRDLNECSTGQLGTSFAISPTCFLPRQRLSAHVPFLTSEWMCRCSDNSFGAILCGWLCFLSDQVREVSAAGVMDEIERIAVEVAESIMDGKGFGFRVPTRSTGNQKYIEELDRIVLGDKVHLYVAMRGA